MLGSPNYIWEQKLKQVKIALKQWVTKHYQYPKKRKFELVNQLEIMQGKMEHEEITRDLLVQEIELERKIQVTLKQEEEDQRLRSRKLQLKGGDQNTKFFHNQYKERQKRNTIKELKKDDKTTISDQAEITTELRICLINFAMKKKKPLMRI